MSPLIIVAPPNISRFDKCCKPFATEGTVKASTLRRKHRQLVQALALIGYTVAPGWSGSLAGGRLLPHVIQLSGGA